MGLKAQFSGRNNGQALAVAGVALFLLWPLLTTGYTSDDLAVSLAPGMRRYHGLSLLGLAWEANKGWLQAGRFFPLACLYVYSVFELFPTLIGYKAFVLTLIVANLLVFHNLVRRLSGSRGLATLSCLSVVALFQYRLGFDPILGFSGLMQALTLAVLGSLVLLCQYLESGKRSYFVASVAAYALAVLTYEMVYPFILVPFLLARAYGRGWKEAGRIVLPFGAVVGLCAGVSLALRLAWNPAIDHAYQPNWSATAYATMLAQQLVAALPLSYLSIDPHHIFQAPLNWTRGFPELGTVLTCALWGLTRWRTMEAGRSQPRRWGLAAVGLSFWILPALLVSLSTKYQQVVRFGTGYLTVFTQYFGVGLLLASVAAGLLTVLPRCPRLRALGALSWAGTVAAVAAVNYAANDRVVQFVTYEPVLRRNLEKGLTAGLMAEVPEQATLLFECSGDHWYDYVYNPYFLCQHGGKRLRVVWSEPGQSEFTGPPLAFPIDLRGLPPSPATFLVKDCLVNRDQGYVFLSELECSIRKDEPKPAVLSARGFRLFVRDEENKNQSPSFRVLGPSTGEWSAVDGQKLRLGPADLTLLNQGSGWALYSFDCGGRVIDPRSLGLVFLRGPLGTFWEGDFYGSEGSCDEVHCCSRWCGRHGTVYVLNGTGQAKTVRLSTDFACLERATLTVRGDGWSETLHLPEQNHFSRVLHLSSGAQAVTFEAEASKERAPGDPRQLTFAVMHFRIEETSDQ
jgi:hypothetical protein